MRGRSRSHDIRLTGHSSEDPEDKRYAPVLRISGIPDLHPSSEDAIHGLARAKREVARLNAALTDEQCATTEYRLVEVAKPRFRRMGQGPPKYKD